MRCQNCGWDNQPNATTCTKCGQALPVSAPTPTPTPSADNAEKAAMADRATVVFKHGEVPQMQDMQTVRAAKVTNCGNCGYPVAGNETHCPACGAPLGQPTPKAEPPKPTPAPPRVEQPTVRFKPNEAPRVEQPTPQAQPATKPYVEQPTVQFKPNETPHVEQATVRFKPCEIPSAPIVTPQATVHQPQGTFVPIEPKKQPLPPTIITEGEHWYIEPSGEEAVLLHVVRRTEIHPGDIINLAGREFRFETT